MSEVNRGLPRIQPDSWVERRKREARAHVKLGALAGALALGTTGDEKPVEHQRAKIEITVEEGGDNPIFDNHPEFFEKHPDGKFSHEEAVKRTKTLPNGEVIFEDIGLKFYRVESGDSISKIRAKLTKYPEYAYLNDQHIQMQSFNIGPRYLNGPYAKNGKMHYMWLPIPLKNEDRHLTDQQFEHYAGSAVKDLHENEGPFHQTVENILEKVTPEEFTASLVAVAKQESGGLPIGQFELHRWEEGHQTFSYSLFHILMEGPGLDARRDLGLTEGQTYHPQNASELFVGYLAEKCEDSKKNPASFFPLDHGSNAKKFATFYNGAAWKTRNPDYVNNLLAYYQDALDDIKKREKEAK